MINVDRQLELDTQEAIRRSLEETESGSKRKATDFDDTTERVAKKARLDSSASASASASTGTKTGTAPVTVQKKLHAADEALKAIIVAQDILLPELRQIVFDYAKDGLIERLLQAAEADAAAGLFRDHDENRSTLVYRPPELRSKEPNLLSYIQKIIDSLDFQKEPEAYVKRWAKHERYDYSIFLSRGNRVVGCIGANEFDLPALQFFLRFFENEKKRPSL